MDALRSQSACQILVSHDMNLIRQECTKVMLLNKGEVELIGKPDDVINYYIERFS